MPLFRVACTKCNWAKGRLRANQAEAVAEPCPQCNATVKRQATGVSSQTKERLDNGAMGRAVERLADAERLYHERAKKSDPLAGGAQRVIDEPKGT